MWIHNCRNFIHKKKVRVLIRVQIMNEYKAVQKYLRSVLEEDVDKADSLSFARRLYKAMTTGNCDSLYKG